MNPIAPRIPERLHLLRLSRDVRRVAVLHVATGRAPLKIRVELDAVRRVDVDALDLAAQALALGQAGHHLERVAEDHAVRPVLVVLVELRLVHALGNTVEVREEVRNDLAHLLAPLSCPAQQVVDQHLGMDLLLDVERRRLDDEVAPVLLVLAAPDELRVEIAVAPLVSGAPRLFRLLLDDGLVLGGRDVLALRLFVLDGLDALAGWRLGFSRHGVYRARGCRTPMAQPTSRRSPSQPGIAVRACRWSPSASFRARRISTGSPRTSGGCGTSGRTWPSGRRNRSSPSGCRSSWYPSSWTARWWRRQSRARFESVVGPPWAQ